MQRVFSEKNTLFSRTMDKQNITVTWLYDKLEKAFGEIRKLSLGLADDNDEIQELKKALVKMTTEREADRVRIARLERAVQSRAQGLEAPEAGPSLLKPDLKI